MLIVWLKTVILMMIVVIKIVTLLTTDIMLRGGLGGLELVARLKFLAAAASHRILAFLFIHILHRNAHNCYVG